MVYLYYISCLRYTILVGNPRNRFKPLRLDRIGDHRVRPLRLEIDRKDHRVKPWRLEMDRKGDQS